MSDAEARAEVALARIRADLMEIRRDLGDLPTREDLQAMEGRLVAELRALLARPARHRLAAAS